MRSLSTLLFVALLALPPSAHGKFKLPKHKRHAPTSSASEQRNLPTLFSSPDAEPDVVPGYVGKAGKPINFEMEPKLASFDNARLLTDLTSDQRKRIDQLQKDTNLVIAAFQDHIVELTKRLDVMKAHPEERVVIQRQPMPSPSELKSEIAELRRTIEEKRRASLEQLSALLTPEQRTNIEKIRRGELLRELPPVEKDHL